MLFVYIWNKLSLIVCFTAWLVFSSASGKFESSLGDLAFASFCRCPRLFVVFLMSALNFCSGFVMN